MSLRDPSPRHSARATQFYLEKYRSGGEQLATLCPIWPVQDLDLKPPAQEPNSLPLDQLAGHARFYVFSSRCANGNVIFCFSPRCFGQETAKDLLVFESSCHLMCSTHGEVLHYLNAECQKREAMNINLQFFRLWHIFNHCRYVYKRPWFKTKLEFFVYLNKKVTKPMWKKTFCTT